MSTKDWSIGKSRGFWILVIIIVLVMVIGLVAVWNGNAEGARLVPIFEKGATFLAAAGVILTVYVMVAQTRASILAQERWREADAEAAKTAETFRLIEKWDDPHFLSARTLNREIGKMVKDLSANEVKARIEKDRRLESSVSLVLNYFELLRLSIEGKRADHGLIRQHVGPIALEITKRFWPWIDSKGDDFKRDIKKFEILMDPNSPLN